MKTVLRADIVNKYRSKVPFGFYGALGHRGVDLRYNYEDLPSPVTGQVVLTVRQNEMGNCLYLRDSVGTIHVFAHLDQFKKKVGDSVTRNEIIAKTGNTGSKTTSPHLHYELLTPSPVTLMDRLMKRTLETFKGYNTDPLAYLSALYFKFHVDLDGNAITTI